MSVLLVAAVIAAQKKREQQYYHKTHHSRKSSKNNSSSSYRRDETYFDYLLKDVAEEGSKLGEFFQMIEKEYQDAIQKEYQKKEKKLKMLNSEFESSIPNYNVLKRELSNKGIVINHTMYDHTQYHAPCLFIEGIGNLFFHSYEEFIQQLRDRLCALEAEKNKNLALMEDLNNQIKIASKKAKYSIFHKSDKKREVDKLNEELYYLKIDNGSLSKKVGIIHTIFSMDEDESGKALLSSSVCELIDTFKMSESLHEARKDYDSFDYYYIKESFLKIDEDILEKVFEKLMEQGKISEVTLQKIFLLMDKVEIKGRRREYDSYYSSNSYGFRDVSKKIMKWFIKNIYEMDEDFVARNIVLEEDDINQEEQDNPKTLNYNQ